MIDIILLQALSGSSIPISKQLLTYCSPFFLAGSRLFLAGALLIVCYLLSQKQSIMLDYQNLSRYAQMIFFGVYAKSMLRYWSLQYITATKMAFMCNITPFIAAALAYAINNEKITSKQIFGMGIGFFGIMPVMITAPLSQRALRECALVSLPELVLLLAIGAYCYGMIVARTLVRESNQPILLINGIRMVGGGFLCLATAFVIEGVFPVQAIMPVAIGISVQLVISNVICHTWYMQLLKSYTVTFVALADLLAPLFTALYGFLFLHETITWHYGLSAILVFSGLYLFYQDELLQEYSVTST